MQCRSIILCFLSKGCHKVLNCTVIKCWLYLTCVYRLDCTKGKQKRPIEIYIWICEGLESRKKSHTKSKAVFKFSNIMA